YELTRYKSPATMQTISPVSYLSCLLGGSFFWVGLSQRLRAEELTRTISCASGYKPLRARVGVLSRPSPVFIQARRERRMRSRVVGTFLLLGASLAAIGL